MAKLYNLAVMTVSGTPGTGTITLGSAVAPYLTFALAGVANGEVVFYSLTDGTSNSEVGYGTYTSSGTTLSRNVYKSTNSNALINASSATIVRIAALSGDGGDLLTSTLNPFRGFDTCSNLQLNASVASNILTIAVKGNNGSDPSNTNPVLVPFRDATIANGDPSWLAITSALSITTNATGATLGTSNTVPFRIWVVLFNNSGTPVLALWQSVTGGASPTSIGALDETSVQTSTAISGSATAAETFYTPNGTTVTSMPFRILGYVEYASGLTTAGTYASTPTKIQLFGPGIKLPGDIVRTRATFNTTTQTDVAGNMPGSSATKPTSAQGTQWMSLSHTPIGAPNIIQVRAKGNIICSLASYTQMALFSGSTLIDSLINNQGTAAISLMTLDGWVQANGTSAISFTVRGGLDRAGTATFNTAATNGAINSFIQTTELMA